MTLLDAPPGQHGVAGARPAPRLLTRAALSLALVVAFPVLVLALVALIVLVNVAMAAVAKVTAFVLLPSVLAVVALLGALRPLVRGERRDTSYGVEVGPADEPALWSLVREVAAEVGTAPPDVVVLTPGTDASVHDETLLLGLVVRRRVLTLGVALLSLLDAAQLRAVLAHEHGHYAAGDTRLSALTYRTREAVDRAAVEMGPGRLGGVFRWYRGRHVRLTERLSRSQEAAADGLSLRVAGPEASADALRRSALGGRLFDAYLEAHVEPLAQAGLRPLDLYGGFRAYCCDPDIAQRAAGLLDCLLEDEGHPSDTHPPLAARLAAFGDPPVVEGVPVRLAAEQPVTGLLADADRVVARLLPGETRPVGPAEVAGEVLEPRRHRRAATVWGAVPPESSADLGSVLALLASPRREVLVRGLVPDLDRMPELQRREVLDDATAGAAGAVVAAALLDTGAACVEPAWGRAAGRLVGPGGEVDLGAVLAPALAAGDVAELQRGVAAVGADLGWRPDPDRSPAPDPSAERPLGVLPALSGWRSTVDLAVYADALVLVPLPRADRVRQGLAIYGDVAGGARRAAQRRVWELLELDADTAARRPGAVRIATAGLTGDLRRSRLGGRRLRLTHPGGRVTLYDQRRLVAPADTQALLQRALPGLVVGR